MKTTHTTIRALLFSALALALSALQPFSPSAFCSDAPRPNIELGLQAYTFRNLTLAETLDCAVAMKIKNIQIFQNQRLSPQNNEKTNHNMSDAAKAEMRALFKARGLNLTSYGVVIGKDEAEWRQIFAFAKEMGLRDIATEPKPEDMPLVDKLSRETGVNVTLHNHPAPNRFADPATSLAAVAPYGKNIGLCADTGHWARGGFDPVATLRRAQGRILSVHFKDLSELGVKTAHDVPWGTGVSHAAEQVLELRRQGFNGIAYMEYEYKLPQAQLFAEASASADWFLRAIAASDDDLQAGRILCNAPKPAPVPAQGNGGGKRKKK